MNTNQSDDRLIVTYLDDRRLHHDRRRQTDRRQSGERLPPSAKPRAYGFRSFDDRRSGSDRRREAGPPLFTAVGAYDPSDDDGPLIDLTAEEIAVLLDRDAP